MFEALDRGQLWISWSDYTIGMISSFDLIVPVLVMVYKSVSVIDDIFRF